MKPDQIVQVEMLLGWQLDEWQRAWLAEVDLTPRQARLAILRPPSVGGRG